MANIRRKLLRTIAVSTVISGLMLGAAGCSAGTSSGLDSSKPATITYAYWDPNMTTAYQAAAKQFHSDNPKVTVKLRQVPFASYFTKLNTQVRSKTAPDVFWLQNIQFPLYAHNGALADLTSHFKDSKSDLSGIPSSAIDTYKVDDKLYALPWQVITFGLYYNKALFKQAGVAEPTNVWTWDDVTKAAEQLTNTANGTYGIASPVWNYGAYYQTMYAYGAKIITKNGKSTDFNSPAAVKGLDFWVNLSKKGYSPSVAQLTDTSQDQWFESGKIAMNVTGSWNASVYAKSLGDNVGIVKVPRGTVDTSGAATTADAVSAHSQYPDQSYKWAEYLSSPAGQKLLNSTSGAAAGAPVNAEANKAWLDGTGTPDANIFLDEIAKSTPLPATKNTEAWENQQTSTLAPAWNGTETTQQVADKMVQIIKKALAAE